MEFIGFYIFLLHLFFGEGGDVQAGIELFSVRFVLVCYEMSKLSVEPYSYAYGLLKQIDIRLFFDVPCILRSVI